VVVVVVVLVLVVREGVLQYRIPRRLFAHKRDEETGLLKRFVIV